MLNVTSEEYVICDNPVWVYNEVAARQEYITIQFEKAVDLN